LGTHGTATGGPRALHPPQTVTPAAHVRDPVVLLLEEGVRVPALAGWCYAKMLAAEHGALLPLLHIVLRLPRMGRRGACGRGPTARGTAPMSPHPCYFPTTSSPVRCARPKQRRPACLRRSLLRADADVAGFPEDALAISKERALVELVVVHGGAGKASWPGSITGLWWAGGTGLALGCAYPSAASAGDLSGAVFCVARAIRLSI
jgi:hypothetical protein